MSWYFVANGGIAESKSGSRARVASLERASSDVVALVVVGSRIGVATRCSVLSLAQMRRKSKNCRQLKKKYFKCFWFPLILGLWNRIRFENISEKLSLLRYSHHCFSLVFVLLWKSAFRFISFWALKFSWWISMHWTWLLNPIKYLFCLLYFVWKTIAASCSRRAVWRQCVVVGV